jgi:hypothetical protein
LVTSRTGRNGLSPEEQSPTAQESGVVISTIDHRTAGA